MFRKLSRLLLLLLVLLAACSQTPSNLEAEPPVAALSACSMEAPFVLGEVIVKFRSDLSKQNLDTLSVPGVQVNRVRSLGTASDAAQLYRANVNGKQGTLELIQTLAARPDVLYAHPNYLLKPFATANDPLYSAQWHYRAINLPTAWDITKGSSSVRVAVLDTGIATGHPDFAGKLLSGYNFVSGEGGRSGDPTDPGGNSGYHGSHVAGTVGAATNNGVGVAGVSWGSRILPVRVLGSYTGELADVIDGILWSVGKPVAGVPNNANPAQVLNLSLGGPFSCSDVPALQDAFNQANAAGAVALVAAGNENSDARGVSPASCNGVITVGATNLSGNRASYSNYGPRIDLMAPGGDLSQDADRDGNPDGVLSTVRDTFSGANTYAYYEGTSMATPHVAGVVALMKSVQPSLSWNQVRDILKRTARPISNSSCSVGCGAGLIDAAAALSALTTSPPVTPHTYTVNFTSSTVPVGRVITSVSLGRGITSSTGTITSNVGIFAKRSDKTGNMAMVTGTAKHLIISKGGTSQTSYAKGGYMDFRFNNFGTGRVEAKTLRIKNTTTTRGTVKVYRGTTLLKIMSVPRTGSGASTTLRLNVPNASLVKVTLTGPGAADNLVFTAP